MKITHVTLIAAVAVLLTFVGCTQPPEDALQVAESSLKAAEDAGAPAYVADLYTAARDSLAAAQMEIDTENAKNAFSRNYGHAEHLLAYVQQTASDAEQLVDARKETMRTENETLFMRIDSTLARAHELIERAPRRGKSSVALVSIRENTSMAMHTLADARTAQANGRYADAHDLAQTALDQVNSVIGQLETDAGQPNSPPRS